jgi:hypothetical protein
MLEKTRVVSTNLDMVGHDGGTNLFIRFQSGVSYQYPDHPYSTYLALTKAERAFTFFQQFIRPKKAVKLDYDPFQSIAA